MKDTALYRKYRPEAFDDVIGQDHIISVLKAALKDDKVSHAYLFAGTRGTGKTTIARILARALGTSNNDMFEIDAASNNGVDDIRQLREAVQSLPFDSKYKVYILDEVHMLSKAAFNALLKTLEEPPAHVIFILATTELDRVPETILSRCQSFTFRRPSEAILRELVTKVAKKEGYALDAGAAELIALLGDRAFRDTLGILEKVITYSPDKKITGAEVEKVTGAPARTRVREIIGAVADRDAARAVTAIREAGEENTDIRTLTKLLLHTMRYILLVRIDAGLEKSLGETFGEEDAEFILRLAKEKEKRITSATLVSFIKAYNEEKFAFLPELPLELAVMTATGIEA